jgi:HlyD family secretion protein
MNKKYLKAAASIMIALSVVGVASCSKNKKAEAEKKGPGRANQSVNITPITQIDLSPKIVIAGQVQAQNEARIYPTSSGARVIQLLADAGQYVSAGQPLARLDSRQVAADSELLAAQVRRAKNALTEAEVSLASANETMNRTINGPKETNLSFEQAQIAYNEAKAQYDRALAVQKVGSLSQEETDRRKAAYEQAKTRLDNQRGDVTAILEARRQTVKQAQARLSSAKSDLEVAIAQKAKSDSMQNNGIISSPVSGLVTARNVQVGDIAGSSANPMFTVVANGTLEVWAEIAESEIGKLAAGMAAQFKAPDGSSVFGTLRQIPAQIDPTKRTGIAKFNLEVSPSVRAGMFLTGEASAQTKMANVIPSSAILYDSEGSSIFVMRPDGTVTKQKVVLGARQGELVELITGPQTGSWVVTSGASFLAENEKINPIKTDIKGNKIAPPAAPQQKPQPAH